MRSETIEKILRDVRSGKIPVSKAMDRLRDLPFETLGFATLDHHRPLRQGIPEVIFCEGKDPAHVEEIFRRMVRRDGGGTVLATRASPELFERLHRVAPRARYNPAGRTIALTRGRRRPPAGRVFILTAGTSDIPVAEEARETAECFGSRVETAYDVGVAGIHRLLGQRDRMRAARVLVVVAGMDGVLPSVVGGLAHQVVIAVPTSRGYGASFGGLAALLTMLNSCAPGVAVVNIDNGFGAGVLAHKINTMGGSLNR